MKAKNLIRATLAIAAVAAFVPGASAQSVSGEVDLQVNLTSQCRLRPVATDPVLNFGTYVAFQAGAATAPAANVVFECTRGFGGTPTATWDTTGGQATGEGVIAGLRYGLTVSAGTRAAGTAATAAALGTADTVTYAVGGSIAGGQAGQGAGGAATASRTLLVTF